MISNRDLDALEDIIYCIDLIYQYKEGLTKNDFYTNQEKQDVLIHRLEIIGEASKRISEEITNVFSGVPWREIKGMRDVLIHQYDNVMLEIVWETIQKRIPELEQDIHKIKYIIEKLIHFKSKLPEMINKNNKIYILKVGNSDYSSLVSNILKEKEISFKLISSLEQINIDRDSKNIIVIHFDNSFDYSNNNIKFINLLA